MSQRAMMEPTDIQLMLRVQAGDVNAFHQLALRYRIPLRRYFESLIADRSLADDCVQETLLRLWAARERYEPTGKFSTYLFQIGKHYWLNQRRKFAAETIAGATADATMVPLSPGSQPEGIVLERLRHERIRRAVATLSEPYRQVFCLCHDEGLRYAEIAERLHIPIGTVKSRMAEALTRLRRALSPQEEL